MVRAIYYIGTELKSSYYISHHGILGQKWGVRRYQNEDGTLTDAGKRRLKNYTSYADKADKKMDKYERKADKHFAKGERKAASFWSSASAAEKQFAKSNKYTAKSSSQLSKLAEKYIKTVKDMDTSKLDSSFVKRGNNYVHASSNRRRNLYDKELSKNMSRKAGSFSMTSSRWTDYLEDD